MISRPTVYNLKPLHLDVKLSATALGNGEQISKLKWLVRYANLNLVWGQPQRLCQQDLCSGDSQ